MDDFGRFFLTFCRRCAVFEMKRNLTIPSQDLKRRKLTTLAPPAHYGVIVNKVKNNYMGVYFCDGKMRYVTEGTIYESIVNAVRNDADKMRKMGCSVAVNVGHERKPVKKVDGFL